MVNKIDSNLSGLSYAEEASIGVLPGSPIWFGLEPNSYKNWGGSYTQTPRNPINPARQRRKGSITDLKVEGGFAADLTHNSVTRLMQGIIFADAREKVATQPLNGTQVALTSITTGPNKFIATGVMPAFLVDHLVFAENCGQASNNGLHLVTAVSADDITVSETLVAEASPPAASMLTAVGVQFASGDVTFTNTGTNYPEMDSTVFDFTTLGLTVGEWVFVGGDATATHSAQATNNGFARISSVAAHKIVFDKTNATWVTDTATGKTIRLFFGSFIKNETATNLIKRRTYALERTLGNDGLGTAAEYISGAIPSEFVLTVKAATKVTTDITFMGIDNNAQDGSVGLKSGTRVSPVSSDCFNSASDFVRMNMHVVSATDANPVPIFAYLTDLTLTIKNNVSANNAIGILGAFDMTAGTFDLSTTIMAYFNSTAAVSAVRANSDFSIDCALVKANRGLVFDAPLVAAGGGLANVVQDKPIELSLTADGAQSAAGYTLSFTHFAYLPNAA